MMGLVLFLIVSVSSTEKPKDGATVATMQQFLHHMIALQPLLSDAEALKAADKKREAKKHVHELARLSEQVNHSESLHSAGRWISAKALQSHLQELDRIFDQAGPGYAYRMLSATLDACSSCHSQGPAKSMSWSVEGLLPEKMKLMNRIEFLFATRHWDKANQLIDGALMSYPKTPMKLSSINRLVDLKLTYYLRVARDLPDAVKDLQGLFANKGLPDSVRQRISEYIFLLRTLSKIDAPDPSRDSARKIEAFAKDMLESAQQEMMETLSDVHRATFLYVSGILYQFLNERKPSDFSAGIYYWLSVCDDALSNQFFFGLAELYLKECVERFPKEKMARQCFNAYKDRQIAAFTGTRGTELPKDVNDEIARLQALLQ